MIDAPIQTSFVALNAPLGFADAAEAVEQLAGHTLSSGRAELEIGEPVGVGLVGAIWFHGVLHTGSLLVPKVPVDVVIAPWSAGRSEIGLRPLGRLGSINSARARRFYEAAWAVLPDLVEALTAGPVGAAAPVEVPAAA
ncbi:MAG: hypothetical protein M0Z30_18390 [Actinomycetota bacterium]|nr:hypothetical protein [Actinomycetota bacterium]